jgi:hypothetical protein
VIKFKPSCKRFRYARCGTKEKRPPHDGDGPSFVPPPIPPTKQDLTKQIVNCVHARANQGRDENCSECCKLATSKIAHRNKMTAANHFFVCIGRVSGLDEGATEMSAKERTQ